MHDVARTALEKLLKLVERAYLRKDDHKPTLVMSEHSCPSYLHLDNRADMDIVHATWRDAERAHAITIQWDIRAGDNGQVTRLRVRDENALVQFLGVKPLWVMTADVRQRLEPWIAIPRVAEVLAAWENGKAVRGYSIHKAEDFVDALRALQYCHTHPGEDLAMRTVSSSLFRSSKRLEDLVGWLDILSCEKTTDRTRTPEEVLASLGLVRYPQPALLAGSMNVVTGDGDVISVPSPYIGIAPASVREVCFSGRLDYILTIENLTTFNEFAARKAGAITGVILYCAGMPAPSFLQLYRKLLAAAPLATPVLHYGDIDAGGFRIAAQLAGVNRRVGRDLQLWGMNPASYSAVESYKELRDADVSEIERICEMQGWVHEADGVRRLRKAYEQEALPLKLPKSTM